MRMKQVYVAYDRTEGQPIAGFRYCPACRAELILQEHGHRLRPTCPACGFVQFMNPAPAVSVVIVQEGKVLLGKRTGPPGSGKWAIPSGYIEYEDDFLTTGIREAKEETGLDVEIQSILRVVSSFLSPRFHFVAIYLLARVVGGELIAGDDLEAVAWYPLSGPWPELAFQEDVDVIERYATHGFEGLPVDPGFASPGGPGDDGLHAW
jgi:8-oxo-dGTP diphosphatase